MCLVYVRDSREAVGLERMVGGVRVTSEDIAQGLSHPARRLCYHSNHLGCWMSRCKGTLWAGCCVCSQAGQDGSIACSDACYTCCGHWE